MSLIFYKIQASNGKKTEIIAKKYVLSDETCIFASTKIRKNVYHRTNYCNNSYYFGTLHRVAMCQSNF